MNICISKLECKLRILDKRVPRAVVNHLAILSIEVVFALLWLLMTKPNLKAGQRDSAIKKGGPALSERIEMTRGMEMCKDKRLR